MSTRPKPISKDMAKYYLKLEKVHRRVVDGRNDEAVIIAHDITGDYTQDQREHYHQRMCDYAYGED